MILDEPTSALSESDSQALLDLMLELKAQVMTQIIISHKLNEVRRIADTVTVIRDGHSVSSFAASEGITEDRIVRDMVGRSMENRYPPREPKIGERIMRVSDWSVAHPEHADQKILAITSLALELTNKSKSIITFEIISFINIFTEFIVRNTECGLHFFY